VIAWVFRREVGDRCHDRESVARRRATVSEVVLGQISNHRGLTQRERQGVYDGALSASIRADESRLLVEDELAVANAAKSPDSQYGNERQANGADVARARTTSTLVGTAGSIDRSQRLPGFGGSRMVPRAWMALSAFRRRWRSVGPAVLCGNA